VELRREGTLVIALTADDQARLFHHLEFQKKLDLPLQWISAAETRRREPHLAGKLAGAVFQPGGPSGRQPQARDRVADRGSSGGCAYPRSISRSPPSRSPENAYDGILLADGRKHAADTVVLAAGAWSRGIAVGIAELAPQARPPVRPIKGQRLALRMDPAAPWSIM